MLDTNMKKNINSVYTKLFSNRINEQKSSNRQISVSNLILPLKQSSVQSLHKINKHYEAFQHALHMLKISVEELWRLELEQLHNQNSISSNSYNIKFDIQVPSIYTCRTLLPIASQIKSIKNQISPKVDSTNTISETISNKIEINQKNSRSNPPSVSSKQSFNKSLLSIPNKKQRHKKSNDNSTKYSTKKALLHLRFHCSKHRN